MLGLILCEDFRLKSSYNSVVHSIALSATNRQFIVSAISNVLCTTYSIIKYSRIACRSKPPSNNILNFQVGLMNVLHVYWEESFSISVCFCVVFPGRFNFDVCTIECTDNHRKFYNIIKILFYRFDVVFCIISNLICKINKLWTQHSDNMWNLFYYPVTDRLVNPNKISA